VLRDFHSPNLLWLPQRSETARLGLLDFQDALIGPAATISPRCCQDARVDVSEQAEIGASRPLRARAQPDRSQASMRANSSGFT
jgi:aminoglycoside/choline kinase family phosphotransferase